MKNVDLERLICALVSDKTNAGYVSTKSIERALQEQGLEYKDGEIIELDSDKDVLKAGNVLRHGGLLVLCLGGRKAVKSNNEPFIIQYPDEWVRASEEEGDAFFRTLLDNGYCYFGAENVVKKIITEDTIDSVVKAYRDSLPFDGEFASYTDSLVHAFRQGIAAGIRLANSR